MTSSTLRVIPYYVTLSQARRLADFAARKIIVIRTLEGIGYVPVVSAEEEKNIRWDVQNGNARTPQGDKVGAVDRKTLDMFDSYVLVDTCVGRDNRRGIYERFTTLAEAVKAVGGSSLYCVVQNRFGDEETCTYGDIRLVGVLRDGQRFLIPP